MVKDGVHNAAPTMKPCNCGQKKIGDLFLIIYSTQIPPDHLIHHSSSESNSGSDGLDIDIVIITAWS